MSTRRNSFVCKGNKGLKKTEIIFKKRDGSLLDLSIIQYRFDNVSENKVIVKPHGNSKKPVPFFPSDRALPQELKEKSTGLHSNENPVAIYNKSVINKKLHTVKAIGALPRDVKQIQNFRNKKQTDPMESLYALYFAQKSHDQFIQQISFDDGNLTVILYTKEQLKIFEECALNLRRPLYLDTKYNRNEHVHSDIYIER